MSTDNTDLQQDNQDDESRDSRGQGEPEIKKIGGPGNPPPGRRFTSEIQPDPANISKGIRKKKFTRDLIRQMLNEPFRINKDSELGKKMRELYGDDAFEIPVGELMTLRQMEKAIATQDTQAFSAVTDQGMGRPVQAIAQTDQAGNDLPAITIALPPGLKLGLPNNTEGTDKKEELPE